MKKTIQKRPQVRNATVQRYLRINRSSETWVSEIRMRGLWLGHLGFLPDQKLTVITMEKQLIIRIVE